MDLSVVLGAALVCAGGGLFPWINSEIAVAGAVLLLPPSALPVLVVACAIGQMATKCMLYGLARWAPDRLPERARRLIAKAERYRDRRRLLGLAVFSGALVALPPFYLVTLACGALRVSFAAYTIAGLAGTVARYGALSWVAMAIRA